MKQIFSSFRIILQNSEINRQVEKALQYIAAKNSLHYKKDEINNEKRFAN